MRGLSGPSRAVPWAAAGATVLLTAAVGVLPAAAATGPLLTLTPATATPGQEVAVAGTGFFPIRLHIQRPPVHQQLRVPPPSTSSSSTTQPSVGQSIHAVPQLSGLSGAGSASRTDTPCLLLLDANTVGDCVLDGAGGLTGSLTVPEGTATGPHEVLARSVDGTGSATLQVLPVVVQAAPPLPVHVPDVRHLTVRSALASLRRAGLRLSGGGTHPVRRIAGQEPAPGATVRPGTAVSVTLDGGPTKGQQPPPSPGPAGTGPSPSSSTSQPGRSAAGPPSPTRTDGATAVAAAPVASLLPSGRAVLATVAAAALVLLAALAGTAVALARRGRSPAVHQSRRTPGAARLLARPDTSTLVRTRQTAPPGPTLLLAPHPDRTLDVT